MTSSAWLDPCGCPWARAAEARANVAPDASKTLFVIDILVLLCSVTPDLLALNRKGSSPARKLAGAHTPAADAAARLGWYWAPELTASPRPGGIGQEC